MSEVDTFQDILLQACQDVAIAVDAVGVSPQGPAVQRAGQRHSCHKQPSLLQGSLHESHPQPTEAPVDGGHPTSEGVDAHDPFSLAALQFLSKHAMWVLGDWRDGEVPGGCHSIAVQCRDGSEVPNMRRRRETFCFWERTERGADDGQPSFLLLRLWFSRRNALEAHRALAYATSRVKYLSLESLVLVPRSMVFACHGAIVSVTELFPMDALPTRSSAGDVDAAWHNCLASNVFCFRGRNTVPLKHSPAANEHDFARSGGLLLWPSSSSFVSSHQSHSKPPQNLAPQTCGPPLHFCRWLFVPAPSNTFELLDHPSPQRSALCSRYVRTHAETPLHDALLPTRDLRMELLISLLVDAAQCDESDVFASLREPAQYEARDRTLTLLFHQAGVNLRCITEVRAGVLSRICEGTEGKLSTKALMVWQALDERLASRGVMSLLQSRLFDVAERSSRCLTEEKVRLERRSVFTLLNSVLKNPAEMLRRGIDAHYGTEGSFVCFASYPLHSGLHIPNSLGLAAVLCVVASLCGMPCSIQCTNGSAIVSLDIPEFEGCSSSMQSGFGTCATEISSTYEDGDSGAAPLVTLQPPKLSPSNRVFDRLLWTLLAPAASVSTADASSVVALLKPTTTTAPSDLPHSSIAIPPTAEETMTALMFYAVSCRERTDQERSAAPSLISQKLSTLGSSEMIAATDPVRDVLIAAASSAIRTLSKCCVLAAPKNNVASNQVPPGRYALHQSVAYRMLKAVCSWCAAVIGKPRCPPPATTTNIGGHHLSEYFASVTAACGVALTVQVGHELNLIVGDGGHRPFGADCEGTLSASTWPASKLRDHVLPPMHPKLPAWICSLPNSIETLRGALGLLVAHVARLVPIENTKELAVLGLTAALAAMAAPLRTLLDTQQAILLALGGMRYTLAFVLLQVMVELEQAEEFISSTVVAIALSRWMFLGLEPVPAPIAAVLNDASATFFHPIEGPRAPSETTERVLQELVTGHALHAPKVAISRLALDGPLVDPLHGLNVEAPPTDESHGLEMEGARALLVTVLVRGDPTGLSSSAKPTPPTSHVGGSLKPQRPPLGSMLHKSKRPTQQVTQQKRQPTLLERVFERWRFFSSPSSMRRYAEDTLWTRTVGILSTSSTVSEVDAEYFLLDFALFGHVECDDAPVHPRPTRLGEENVGIFVSSDTERYTFGAVGKCLQDVFDEPFQRRAVLVALLLASSRCITLFRSMKPPFTLRTKETMGSVIASVVLILKLQDELLADLEDEEPVLLSLLDIATWLAGTGNAEDKILCRAVALFVTRDLLPWGLLSQYATAATVEAVMELFYRLDAWQVDPYLTELPFFLTDSASESVMLVLDSFDDTDEEYPAVSRVSRILNRTLAGFEDVCSNFRQKAQRAVGTTRPPSTTVTGRKRIISPNASGDLLRFDPAAAFLAAEESDRMLLAHEECHSFQESLAEFRRLVPPAYGPCLAHAADHDSLVVAERSAEEAQRYLVMDMEPKRRLAVQEEWRCGMAVLETEWCAVFDDYLRKGITRCAKNHQALAYDGEGDAGADTVEPIRYFDEGEEGEGEDAALVAALCREGHECNDRGQPDYAAGQSQDIEPDATCKGQFSEKTTTYDESTPFRARTASSMAEATWSKDIHRQEVDVRETQWRERNIIEKEAQCGLLALLASAQLEATAMLELPDSERAFFSRKTPSPTTPIELDEATLAALHREATTLLPPSSFRISDDESNLREMIEDMWHAYWGVLLLEMKRSFLLSRTF